MTNVRTLIILGQLQPGDYIYDPMGQMVVGQTTVEWGQAYIVDSIKSDDSIL